ncbi:hypothetical protein KGQ20_04055 [Catenulispora sp. NF23]|uniref:Uncharacterized protein n=1 Tax=Catenulispora pinistramenti TaxID=2705254 RepID=A0ABS5KII0_9ACTN|nr:hypothetical protein [Catenulispora pinistramenti]MBS2531937.1 hypothetical protein [Catenulispora pinistramenti]MBS2546204.1 hypothetical protein [Catenulispora pinistramenti]
MADLSAQVDSDLEHAARVILRNGLNQGSLYDYEQADQDKIPLKDCRVCGLGTIHIVISGTPSPNRWSSDRYNAVIDRINDYMWIHHTGYTLPKWNDEPGRTADQVAELLRSAAAWRPTPTEALADTCALVPA